MAKPGRKTVKDKVEGLTIYVKGSIIKKKGGRDKCRLLLLEVAEQWGVEAWR